MSEIRRLRQLVEENGRLKKIVAQQALDLDRLNFSSPDKSSRHVESLIAS
jgi:hypothetical protein